jgi:serine/threonine protein kinase
VTSTLRDQLQSALGQGYVLDRELGGGGMSHVFLAHEQALGRQVVVKVLLPELAAGVNIDRFRREIQLAAQLQHPHIVPLLSAGEAEGLPYFIMPYVTGESLRAKVGREGELPVAETVRILRDVVSALAYAHARGVVHRDVKPDNVLLSGGVAVVTDFGVAKAVSVSSEDTGRSGITSLGLALGTPTYMSPEQATASPQTDHRADIYALGVMTYEMLTGLPPFTGRSAQAVLSAHVVEEAQPVERRRPAVPPMLASLVHQCLAKRPADRPQSAAELMHTLDALATPSGGTAPTTVVQPIRPSAPTPAPAAGPKQPRHGRRLVALAVVAAIGIVVVLLTRPRQPPGPAPTATAVAPDASVTDSPVPAPAATHDSAAQTRGSRIVPREPERAPPRQVAPTPAKARTGSTTEGTPPPKRRVADTVRTAQVPPIATDTTSRRPRAAVPVDSSAPAPPAAQPAAPAAAPSPKSAPAVATTPKLPPVPAPPATPVDPAPQVRAVVSEYAAAVESGSLNGVRRVYPTMTLPQQRGWEQFFQLVRDVKADLTVGRLDVTDGSAEAQVGGSYTYLNTSTQRTENQPVAFRATLRREGGRWRIAQIR